MSEEHDDVAIRLNPDNLLEIEFENTNITGKYRHVIRNPFRLPNGLDSRQEYQKTSGGEGDDPNPDMPTEYMGDMPDEPDSFEFSVEDWKPRIFRYGRWILGVATTGLTALVSGGGLTAMQFPKYFWYIIAGVVAAVILLIGTVLSALGALGLALWKNRSEISGYWALETANRANPLTKNFGLSWEKML